MSDNRKVLAISKRTMELCAAQTQVYAAGFEMITATSLAAAHAVLNSFSIEAVIVCRHSWSDEERGRIETELAALHPKLPVVMRCPGCTGCDDRRAGTLSDPGPVTSLIDKIRPFRR